MVRLEFADRSTTGVTVRGADDGLGGVLGSLTRPRRVTNIADRCQSEGIVPVVVAADRSGPAGIFPLRFGGQPIRLSFLLRQPGTELDRIVVRHVNDGRIVRLFPPPIAPGVVWPRLPEEDELVAVESEASAALAVSLHL